MPDSGALYAKFEANFRDKFFWKIIEFKENMVTQLSNSRDSTGIPTKKELKRLSDKID